MQLYFLKSGKVALGFDAGPVPIVAYADLSGARLAPRDKWLRRKQVRATYEFEPNWGRLMIALQDTRSRYTLLGWFTLGCILAYRWLRKKFYLPKIPAHESCGPEFVARVLHLPNPEHMLTSDLERHVQADPERFNKL